MTLLDILRPRRTESPPPDYTPPPELLRPMTDDEARQYARALSPGRASATQRLADTGQICGYLLLEVQAVESRILEDPRFCHPNRRIQFNRFRQWIRERISRLHATEPPAIVSDVVTGSARFACEPCPYHDLSATAFAATV